MLPRNHPDRIHVAFDDRRLINNAGLILPATLALHLGLPELVDRHLDLGDAPGRAHPGDKVMTLVASAPRFRGGRVWLGATASTMPTCCALARRLAPSPRGQGASHPGYLPVSVLKNALSGRFSASDDSASPLSARSLASASWASASWPLGS